MMKFGLTRAGIGNIGSDEQFIQAAAAHGFQAVDGNVAKFVEQHGVDGAKAMLEQHGIEWAAFGLPVEWRNTEEAFRAGLPELVKSAQAAAAIGCDTCCTYILPSTDLKPAAFMAQAIKRLRTCAQVLGAYGIRLGLEYVGPHHLRTHWKHPFIWTQAETQQLMDAIGEPNTGFLLDSIHWYTTGLSYDDIAGLDPSQIVYVHINDAPSVPVEEVLDNDRLHPGEGVIDLAAFLKAVHQTGYRGFVCQEVLTKEPPKQTAQELLQRSKIGLDKVLAAAGLELGS